MKHEEQRKKARQKLHAKANHSEIMRGGSLGEKRKMHQTKLGRYYKQVLEQRWIGFRSAFR